MASRLLLFSFSVLSLQSGPTGRTIPTESIDLFLGYSVG